MKKNYSLGPLPYVQKKNVPRLDSIHQNTFILENEVQSEGQFFETYDILCSI